jgi:integrase
VDNVRIEDLSSDQMIALLKAIEEDTHPLAGTMMKLVLFTGMRRGELFKLQWDDLDFNRGFIFIRDPKGRKSQQIPMNDSARKTLEDHPRKGENPYVFPGRGGGQRVDISKAVNRIKETAKLPKDFRPLLGLRHVYASMLASSGKVDMYTLQKLLTHKSPLMTQRYAHLRDSALKQAADVASDIISQAMKGDKVAKIK